MINSTNALDRNEQKKSCTNNKKAEERLSLKNEKFSIAKFAKFNLKNKILNMTNDNTKYLKNLLGNLTNHKKDNNAKEEAKKIINDDEFIFDYLNFYTNEIPNFGGNM